jgi:hypothetical protein
VAGRGDGALVQVLEQQAAIQQIVDLRRQDLSLCAISAKIGGTVSHVTVKSIIMNAARCARLLR